MHIKKTEKAEKLLRISHIGSVGRVVNSVIQVESHWQLATRTLHVSTMHFEEVFFIWFRRVNIIGLMGLYVSIIT